MSQLYGVVEDLSLLLGMQDPLRGDLPNNPSYHQALHLGSGSGDCMQSLYIA
jgi:hypothetical protein